MRSPANEKKYDYRLSWLDGEVDEARKYRILCLHSHENLYFLKY